MRRMEMTAQEPANNGYRVVISSQGEPLTQARLESILRNPKVSFYLGDSKGVPSQVMNSADEIVSVTSLHTGHQLEAAILTESLETALLNNQACRV